MPSTKGKKSKNKLLKIDMESSSDSDDGEHELSYYAKDKVKLMKEVLKLVKPKKIKSMAPDCIKDLDIGEISSMLLEELLGISNKRLQYIFNGENVDRETSSSESEEEKGKQPIDVISLDDISDDDDIELCISEQERNSLENATKKNKDKLHKIKTEPTDVSVKLEKVKKESRKKSKKSSDDWRKDNREKLMSVLELLELQARARAIRSQLAIENDKKQTSESEKDVSIKVEDSDSDAIIIETPERKEIVIDSTDSEKEEDSNKAVSQDDTSNQNVNHDAAPPQKRRKPHCSSNTISNKAVETETVNSAGSSKIVEIINLDELSKDLDSDNKRKQRLMAKIQKVRLIRNRNKNDARNINEDSNKNDALSVALDMAKEAFSTASDVCNNSVDISESITEMSEEACIIKNTVNVDEKQIENKKSNEDNANNLKIEMESSPSITKEEKIEETINVNKAASTVKASTSSGSFCDNDEIVINLDEDEMDGIDND